MTLADIKTYLDTRINAVQFLELQDEQLSKYMLTSINLLDTFYIMEELKDDEKLAKVVGEEMLFLFNSNIDLNLFYQYEGLTSFGIGNGSIQSAVDYSNKGDLFSPIVKAMLDAFGVEERIESPNARVKSGFTWL